MFCKLRRLELLRSGQLSDCELHVWYMDKCKKRCYRQFRCHKVMLASASIQFEQMMNDKDFELNKRVMNVDDASPDAYETLLLYIYTYEIYNNITIEMCTDLIYLASKFKMPDFVEGYIGKLANQSWPMATVLKIFQLANEHNRPAMMQLVGQKIVPVAKQLLNDNSFLKFSVKELNALMVILKSAGTIPDKELLLALKKYQISNDLHYRNMVCFQQFVEVTHLFDGVLFEADGTLSVREEEAESKEPEEAEKKLEPAVGDEEGESKESPAPTLDEQPESSVDEAESEVKGETNRTSSPLRRKS